LNAFTPEMNLASPSWYASCREDDPSGVVVFTGKGKAFSAGAD